MTAAPPATTAATGAERLLFVVQPLGQHPGADDFTTFRRQMRDTAAPALLRGEAGPPPRGLTLTFTAAPPPRLALFPFRRRPLALFALEPEHPAETLTAAPALAESLGRFGTVAGYRVKTTIARDYHRSWPPGQPTPGVGLLTLFRRRPGLSDELFRARWEDEHGAFTLAELPVWRYLRNAVLEPLPAGPGQAPAPRWDGIVEEHFRRRDDLLNPLRFYGGPAALLPNLARLSRDIARFIHLPSLQTYLVKQLILRP